MWEAPRGLILSWNHRHPWGRRQVWNNSVPFWTSIWSLVNFSVERCLRRFFFSSSSNLFLGLGVARERKSRGLRKREERRGDVLFIWLRLRVEGAIRVLPTLRLLRVSFFLIERLSMNYFLFKEKKVNMITMIQSFSVKSFFGFRVTPQISYGSQRISYYLYPLTGWLGLVFHDITANRGHHTNGRNQSIVQYSHPSNRRLWLPWSQLVVLLAFIPNQPSCILYPKGYCIPPKGIATPGAFLFILEKLNPNHQELYEYYTVGLTSSSQNASSFHRVLHYVSNDIFFSLNWHPSGRFPFPGRLLYARFRIWLKLQLYPNGRGLAPQIPSRFWQTIEPGKNPLLEWNFELNFVGNCDSDAYTGGMSYCTVVRNGILICPCVI